MKHTVPSPTLKRVTDVITIRTRATLSYRMTHARLVPTDSLISPHASAQYHFKTERTNETTNSEPVLRTHRGAGIHYDTNDGDNIHGDLDRLRI